MTSNTPWTKLSNETQMAFHAFTIYRDLGANRSYSNVVNALNKEPGYKRQIEAWSSKYEWVYRAGCYDSHLDLIKIECAEANIIELQDVAFKGAKEALERLIDIGVHQQYCENYELKAIEILLKSVGLVNNGTHLKMTLRNLQDSSGKVDLEALIAQYSKS